MLWRATRASVGFLNKAARDIIEEYAKNITGKTATQPRWKSCVSSAAGSFSAAVGKMYVSKYFKEDAKDSMLEMVQDIREEFRLILNEVCTYVVILKMRLSTYKQFGLKGPLVQSEYSTNFL